MNLYSFRCSGLRQGRKVEVGMNIHHSYTAHHWASLEVVACCQALPEITSQPWLDLSSVQYSQPSNKQLQPLILTEVPSSRGHLDVDGFLQ